MDWLEGKLAKLDQTLAGIALNDSRMRKLMRIAGIYERARALLVGRAKRAGIELRQSYARLAPRLAVQVGRYAHARQFKRMRKTLRQLKGYVGRVRRDLHRHLQEIPQSPRREGVLDALWLVGRLLEQGPKSCDKIYSLHEPEVDCISKGKARVRYEFGTKVSLATMAVVFPAMLIVIVYSHFVGKKGHWPAAQGFQHVG